MSLHPHIPSLKANSLLPPPLPSPLVLGFLRQGFSNPNPGCPGTRSVDQAGLELRDLPASASQVLGLTLPRPSPNPGIII